MITPPRAAPRATAVAALIAALAAALAAALPPAARAGAAPAPGGSPVLARPLFRRYAVEQPGLRFEVQFDRADPEGEEDRAANVRLAGTLARVVAEERQALSGRYGLLGRRIGGLLTTQASPWSEPKRLLPVAEALDLREEPQAVARLGAEEWARREVRRSIVQMSLVQRAERHRGGLLTRQFAKRLQPFWLPLGLSWLEAEPWSPEKMALVADAVERNDLIPLERYTHLDSFSALDQARAVQESQAFCQWLVEKVGDATVLRLLEAYTQAPLDLDRAFKRLTDMTLAEASAGFREALRDFLARAPRVSPGERLVAVDGVLGRVAPSPDDALLAFTSNHLRSEQRIHDLFLCRRRGGTQLTFAVANVLPSFAWHAPSGGLFLLREEVSTQGKRFQQLAWLKPPRALGSGLVGRGLDWRVVMRGTRFDEVAVSQDGARLALLRQRPGGGELCMYALAGRPPRLSPERTLPFDGVDVRFAGPDRVVFRRSARGASALLGLDLATGTETLLACEQSPIQDLAVSGEEVLYGVPWAEDRGVLLKALPLTGGRPTSRRLVPGAGFRFAPAGEELLYVGVHQGGYAIFEAPAPKEELLPVAVTASSAAAETAPATAPSSAALLLEGLGSQPPAEDATGVTGHLVRPHWLPVRVKGIVGSNSQGVAFASYDTVNQKSLMAAGWRDGEHDRLNFEALYMRTSTHPRWWVGAFNTTTDDYLTIFPLSRFKSDAFLRGGSVGVEFDLAARESLSLSLEVKDNTYLPESFRPDVTLPANMTVSNTMYRLIYTWDLREPTPTRDVNPYGNRLFQLSFADSPAFLEDELRYHEVIADWREYLRAGPGSRDSVALRLVGGNRVPESTLPYPVDFQIGGPKTLRGVQEDVLRGRKFALATVEYRRPLLSHEQMERRLSVLRSPLVRSLFYFDTVHLAAFFDAGTATDRNISLGDLEKGVGFELRAQSTLSRMHPLVYRLGFAHGLDDLGENTVYFHTGTVF